MIISSAFKSAWWLPNPHLQTMFPTLIRRSTTVVDMEERFELADGDFVDLCWAINGLSSDTPLVIFLHGLGGSVSSSYVAGQMEAFNRQGWRVVLMHFRGASLEPNRLPRAYHSGDTSDLNYFLRVLQQREPNTKKAAVGISLGGNVLLKWLGEQGPQNLVDVAVAVSVPFVLRAVPERMSQGFSRLYERYLLNRMRTMFERKYEKYPDGLRKYWQDIESADCFWIFDDKVTAPLHGFPHAHAYYRESSSRQFLPYIATPTLIIHALDDPFMTPDVIPTAEELSSSVTLELSETGGHVGFISGLVPGRPEYWLDQRVPEFLQDMLNN